ncbi:carbon monoxide dehydrogenase subunit G [Sphingobium sp. AP49]|uniref:CoxG family protein n=1 Tax=Sphingobium sp. AP49 TaxID=1144307 RepID=UPI00026ED184|nr:carbon monoxide dehydrogenase subunit G [Sphingobium sp. AP49]WHO38764.1 carbon monoxide dehydrogenase subunit G [Sphingobium sp. AP49]
MRMTGEERIAAPRQQVWAALNDPAILRRSIPGCQSLEKDGADRLRATVEIKIGPIGARFNGLVLLSDIDPPNGYTITGEGQGGTVGHAKGGARVALTDDGDGCLLTYEVHAEVGGRLAQLGGPIIDATAKQLAAKFFATFGAITSGTEISAASGVGISSDTGTMGGRLPAPATPMPSDAAPPFPWGWIICLILAILTGFLMGRTMPTGWWAPAVIILVIAAASAGFEAGQRRRRG